MKFRIPLFLAFASLLFCNLARAQDEIIVTNAMYHHGLHMAGNVALYVVQGISPVLDEEVAVPRRIVRLPIDESKPVDVRIARVLRSDAITASPFYRYVLSMSEDSTLTMELRAADIPVKDRGGMSAEILSKQYEWGRHGLELVIELPLLEWDATTNEIRWIEEYVFESYQSQGLVSSIPARFDSKPHYATQPFTTRSHNVDTSQAWIDFGNTMLRFFVTQDGLYKVTADWIRAAGMDPAGIDPARLQLYRKGVAVPLYMHGMEDGRFDDGDYLLFHGTRNYEENGYRRLPANVDDPVPQYMSIFTDSTAYWFNFNVNAPARISEMDLRGQGVSDTVDWAYRTVHIERDTYLFHVSTSVIRGQLPDWTSEDSWYIGGIRPGGVARERFTVDSLFVGPDARYWCKAVSWFGDPQIQPNHSLSMNMNTSGTLDSVAFNLNEQVLLHASFPSSYMFNGIDTLKVTSHNVQGPGYNEVVIDWYEVEYPRYLKADDGQFIFRSDSVMGFGQRLLRIQSGNTGQKYFVRVGEGSSVILPAIDTGEANVWLYADTLLANSTYIFADANSLLQPAPAERRVIRPLSDTQAAYLIVTAEEFLDACREYGDFITSTYGVSTRVVSIDDIYDVYSYGMFQPEAIKLLTFDAYYDWKQDSLRYVFLIGDANYNYKWTTAAFSKNFVPSYGNPVSDIWYVCFDALQARPALPIGRLSARSASEVRSYLDKHRAYLLQPYDLWNKSTLHFSGGNLNLGNTELLKYKGINDVVINNLVFPPEFSGQATHFFKTLDPQTDFGPYPDSFIRERIGAGGVFISYVGHSGTATWDNSISNPEQLQNDEGRGSLVTDFGCSTARFAEPDIESFSEVMVSREGSHFIGYVGNASAGFESTTSILPFLYYRALIRDRIPTVGEALIESKYQLQDLYGLNIVNYVSTMTNLLMGDPIIRIALPEKTNPVIRDRWLRTKTDIITDVMDTVRFSVGIGNYGLQPDDSLDVRMEHIFAGVPLDTLWMRVPIPAIYDTLQVALRASGQAGQGLLRVTLDPFDLLDEIHEDDNTASLRYQVLSTFLNVVDERLDRSFGGRRELRVLNPSIEPLGHTSMVFEFDTTARFETPRIASAPFGKTETTLDWPQGLPDDAAQFWRVRLDGGSAHVGPFKRHAHFAADFVQADSADFSASTMTNLHIDRHRIVPPPPERVLQVESSGWATGVFGAIRLNGINVLKSTLFRGYSMAVFDSLTMKLLRLASFDNYGFAAHRDSIRVWVETLQPGEILAISTADEPLTGSQVFAEAMRSIGSTMIDSVRRHYRSSWAIIGHKGAAPGSVPEGFARADEYRKVIIDQVFNVTPDSGSIVSPPVGPATAWNELRLRRSPASETNIHVRVSGVDSAGRLTPLIDAGNVDVVPLTGVDAGRYPHVVLEATLIPEAGALPEIDAWGVSYKQPAELAVNYQSVAVLTDSVVQGTPMQIAVGILNAGESDAESVPVALEIVGNDNIPRPASAFTVPRIAARSWFDSTLSIATDAITGQYQLRVYVDKENTIREQYEDNNSFFTSLYVKADTSRPRLDIAFDGYLPLDGDYIRYNPEIVLTLHTPPPFPIDGKEKYRVSIDGDLLDLDSISVSFTPSTRETPAVLRFQPLLADGEYYFGFNAMDGADQRVYEEDLEIYLRVSSQSRITELYNYPNPFAGETSFTFLLTGADVPDEVQVKVYTIAGRLIRTMTWPATSLRIGYNALKWDGRDQDGDEIANGVYFFKLISRFHDTTVEEIGRMSVLR
jgi:hypothetical protein